MLGTVEALTLEHSATEPCLLRSAFHATSANSVILFMFTQKYTLEMAQLNLPSDASTAHATIPHHQHTERKTST